MQEKVGKEAASAVKKAGGLKTLLGSVFKYIDPFAPARYLVFTKKRKDLVTN